jgi:hypothetical protein
MEGGSFDKLIKKKKLINNSLEDINNLSLNKSIEENIDLKNNGWPVKYKLYKIN